MLVLTEYVMKHEINPLGALMSIKDLCYAARKVQKGLSIAVKPPQSLEDYQCFKVSFGRRHALRMIVFVVAGNKKVVPLLIRAKSDKKLGMNMALENPAVRDQLEKNLDRVLLDIEQKRYQEIEIGGDK